MNTIFMNSENSKTYDLFRLVLSNFIIYYKGKNIKKHIKTINLAC